MRKKIDKNHEFNHFHELSDEWWDPNGKFKPLHKFNPIRIRYIKDSIIKHFKIKSDSSAACGE